MNMWVVSSFPLFMNNTSVNIDVQFCECAHMFLFLLSMYLRVELLDYIVTPCLTI